MADSGDLAEASPDRLLFVATDAPDRFRECPNVRSRFHRRTGLFHCLNDKRFPVYWALGEAERAVFLDADTRIEGQIPDCLNITSPLATIYTPNLLEQAKKYLPRKDREAVLRTARSFGVEPGAARFVWDNIFSIANDAGRERVFFATWELITRALDFQAAPITDGYCMSIAAAVAGWRPAESGLESIDAARRHAGVSAANRSDEALSRSLKRLKQWILWQKYRISTITKI